MSGAAKVAGAVLPVLALTALAYGAVTLALWTGRHAFGRTLSSNLLEFIFFAVAGLALLAFVWLEEGKIRLPLAAAPLRLDRVTLAFAVATLAFQVVEMLVFSTGIFGSLGDPMAGQRAMCLLGGVNAVVMAPLVEEAMFRGFLHTRVERAAGPVGALTVSALCFAAFHGENGIGYMFAMVPAGFFLGYARMKSGAIALPMAIHAWMNASIGIVAMVFM